MNTAQYLIEISSSGDKPTISRIDAVQRKLDSADRSAARLSGRMGGLGSIMRSLPGAEFFLNPIVWCALTAGLLFCGVLVQLFPRLKTVLTDESRIYPWELVLMPILFFLCVISLVANTYNPFIYFRF